MADKMTDVTSDDRLWAALAYVFTPLVPIIILLMNEKKDRPFIRAHNAQALAWAVALFVLNFILTSVTFGLYACLWPITIIPQLYWGYKAYQGEMVNIPVISDFVRNQGWA
jgi:uncharacterized membrane protein